MCNFAHLQVGESVTLYTKEMNCLECGQASDGVIANGVYLGHSENTPAVMDRFSLSSFHKCPHCGKKFTMYQEFCNDWNFVSREAAKQLRAVDASSQAVVKVEK
jgi:rRNA maturation protein Nop10